MARYATEPTKIAPKTTKARRQCWRLEASQHLQARPGAKQQQPVGTRPRSPHSSSPSLGATELRGLGGMRRRDQRASDMRRGGELRSQRRRPRAPRLRRQATLLKAVWKVER